MSGPKPQDITGQKFGRLTALCRIGKTKGRISIWECQCECGQKHNAIISQLRNGTVKSCGCLQRVDHPVAKERLFNIWQGMRQRCNNPNANFYEYYGAKGVKICQEWNEYKAFKQWAVENGYDEGLSIDRIDVDGGYNPNNCRWISLREQQSNKSNNVFVLYQDEDITLAELSRRTGLSLPMLHRRYHAGYTGEKLWQTTHLKTGKEVNTSQEVSK
jgi:hypothetical protein